MKWTLEEEKKLLNFWKAKASIDKMAVALKRSKAALYCKMGRLDVELRNAKKEQAKRHRRHIKDIQTPDRGPQEGP